MFGLGRLSRGLRAQDEINNYERLVEEAENVVLAAEAEVEEMKAEAEEEDEQPKKNPEQLDLIGKDWNTHVPAGGLVNFGGYGNSHGSAFGQEPIFYRKSHSNPFNF